MTTAAALAALFVVFAFLMGASFLFEDRLTIRDGNLVIIRVDFRKG